MRLYELFLDEAAVRPALLYHGTDCDNASQIIETNRLNASTSHRAFKYQFIDDENVKSMNVGFRPKDMETYDNGETHNVYGVSLTRDPNFARRWKSGQGVVFVLDGAKLRHKHRMLPFDYYGTRKESEEFVVGQIDNLSNYLVAIEAPRWLVHEMEEDDAPYDPEHGRYTNILQHPLLKIVGDRWNPLTGRVENIAPKEDGR